MGSLKKFFRNVSRDGSLSMTGNGFERIPKLELESHLSVSQYGSFVLTEAVRPSFDLRVVPRQGYRHDRYRDEQTGGTIPVLMASASQEKLFEIFIDLLNPIGDVVDVVLETSHQRSGNEHTDLYREQIDLPILKSYLYDYEKTILNDGCSGIAVLNPSVPCEVQFDEHKMLIVYAENLAPYEAILEQHGIRQDESIHFLTEAEHVHLTNDEHRVRFQQLQTILGIDDDRWSTFQ